MSSELPERLIPTPVGFDSAVKRKAARAERAWEATTGLLGAGAAAGTAAVAAGLAIPPLAPFVGLIAGSSFYFKLRAKWAKEDPARPDFHVPTEYRPRRLDVMAVMPPGSVPPGAGMPGLLHAAGASVEAMVLCVERAMGAYAATRETADQTARAALAERLREAIEHARRTEILTTSLSAEWQGLQFRLREEFLDRAFEVEPPTYGEGVIFTDVVDNHVLGQIIAAGLDERLLAFPVGVDRETSMAAVMEDAGDAASDLGLSLRRWALETAADPSLQLD